MRFQGFVGPSYTLRSVNVDCQRCVGLYPEMNETGRGKENEVAALVATPGLVTLLTLPGTPVRGLYTASNGDLYAVAEDKLYYIDSNWASTELGTLQTNSGPVSMADNGFDLVIVDGSVHGYVLVFATDTFAQITDPDFLGANQVTYQDGYFIFNKLDTGQFYISSLNGTDFDALDFASSEGNPDKIIGLISDHRDLWLFNDRTTEVFYNSGNADFPFERVQGAFIEHGCAARFSIAKMNNSVFWLGKDEKGQGIVYMASGYNPKRISTHAIEQAIQSYSNISDARAYAYQEFGHDFYVLSFPSANTTWVFDASTSLWHERVYLNDGQEERHRSDSYAFAYNKHVVGDRENGKIYHLSSDAEDDAGVAIKRSRTAPHVSSETKRVFYHKFELDIETGVGIDGSGQGDNPQVMLEFSDDHGHSWSNEKWASIGRIGNRKKRALWRRLGSSRDRVFRVTITDPVRVTILGADMDLERGAS